ncbi:hypothetical protein P7K49_000613 [Saguinus oedipus]|uniref:Uncharacterized protein n=1 Tax=Saguinus oedipus TaxID=9490 RepID=A0ABQ9WFU5_SAGOE|nr:hypothetical protein P7K49_000613 [Saguinus oedipus]
MKVLRNHLQEIRSQIVSRWFVRPQRFPTRSGLGLYSRGSGESLKIFKLGSGKICSCRHPTFNSQTPELRSTRQLQSPLRILFLNAEWYLADIKDRI